jgi:hypothetical protein
LNPSEVVWVGLDVDEQLGEPRCVISLEEAADQGGAVGLGACRDVEQLAGALFAEGRDHPSTEVVRTRGNPQSWRPLFDLPIRVIGQS